MIDPWNIVVMSGGPSAEREVSLRSGAAVAQALRSLGHRVTELDPKPCSWKLPEDTKVVFLALHGTYGLCWLLKHAAFPDRSWERRITLGGAFMSVATVLGPYWLFPFLLVSDVLGPRPAPGRLYP